MADSKESKVFVGGPLAAAYLAETYLAETGLTLEKALRLLPLLQERFPHDLTQLKAAERAELDERNRQYGYLFWWTKDARRLRALPVDVAVDPWVSEEERRAILAAVLTSPPLEDTTPTRLGGSHSSDEEQDTAFQALQEHSPTYRAVVERIDELYARCMLSPAVLKKRIAALLTRPDGTRAPTPAEWCAARGAEVGMLTGGLYQANAQRLVERAQKRGPVLPNRIVFPRQFVDAAYRPQVAAGLRKKVDARELTLWGDDYAKQENTLAVLQSEEIQTPQLGKLTTPQVRTLCGVYRLASAGDDNGRLRDGFTVPAALMWQAMGLTGAVRDGERRTHFAALVSVASVRLRWTATVETKKGSAVMAGECAPFEVRPIWSAEGDGRRGYTADEAREIADEWQRREPADEWKGPLPDYFAVTIPNDMRAIDKRLVLAGTVLDKLEAGAKEVRGARESFSRLDWVLWMTITQTKQIPQSGRAFVDVATVLENIYGAEQVAAQRRKGKLKGPSGYLTQYEKAVAVLEAGHLARRVEANRTTNKGKRRDVFEILPGNVLTGAIMPANAPTLPGL